MLPILILPAADNTLPELLDIINPPDRLALLPYSAPAALIVPLDIILPCIALPVELTKPPVKKLAPLILLALVIIPLALTTPLDIILPCIALPVELTNPPVKKLAPLILAELVIVP